MTPTEVKPVNVIHLYKGTYIECFLVREAYARSGNAHNPTKVYSYAVKDWEGGTVYITSTLRAAKAFIDDVVLHMTRPYVVFYDLFFSGPYSLTVEADSKEHALEVARAEVARSGVGYGGNLKEDSFRVGKKLPPRKLKKP